MSKKFCVIAGHAGAVISGKSRKWFDTVEAGAGHARKIIRDHYHRQGQKPITLYVVGVEKVVEAGVPQIVEREPTAEDTSDGESSDAEDDPLTLYCQTDARAARKTAQLSLGYAEGRLTDFNVDIEALYRMAQAPVIRTQVKKKGERTGRYVYGPRGWPDSIRYYK